MDKCACCDEELDQEGDCPNGCTDDDLYGVAVGAHQHDEYDDLKKSIMNGECQLCGKPMADNLCPEGCFPDYMLDDEGMKLWLRDL